MKVLLVGPYPPPRGGVSIHVARARALLGAAGLECRILNSSPRAVASDEYVRARSPLDLARIAFMYALKGWTLHVHTNGHNARGWLLAAVCGVAANPAPASVLTLHSGLIPLFLEGSPVHRRLARRVALLYKRVICVSPTVRDAIAGIGVPASRLDVLPAFLPVTPPECALPRDCEEWLASREPVLASVLSFRPEYGFDLLLRAVSSLRLAHPRLGLAVLGIGPSEREAELRVRSRGLADAVRLLGDVPHEVCLAVVARARLMLRPTFADGDAISVREALALGVPVVASDAAQRPSGTVVFRSGSAEALVAAADGVLETPDLAGAAEPQPNRLERLLEIYAAAAH